MSSARTCVLLSYAGFILSGAAVYFLVKRGVTTVAPLTLSGLRLSLAGVLLLLLSLITGADFTGLASKLWRFAIVGIATFALPHGLLFLGLRGAVDESAAAFIDGTIPAIVMVILFAGRRSVEAIPCLCIALALLGLAVFLGLTSSGKFVFNRDVSLVVASATITAIGLVLTQILPAAPPQSSLAIKFKHTLRQTSLTTLSGGVATLLFVGIIQRSLSLPGVAGWRSVVALAIVGSCLGWASLFFLVALTGDLVLATSAVAAIPLAAWLVDLAFFGGTVSWTQGIGGVVVLSSLAALIVSATRNRHPSKP